jgi:dTDP-4-amino-4,6-dideoxygalactose transaminase
MALKALNITKEVITTPFSYVATTNAILWQGCKPVFADIDRNTLCIDPKEIEGLITENTEAILATHVYGYPCDIDAIEAIAKSNGLSVIYDGAHAFGCEINGNSVLSFGDISTCSFHATKVFHTVEGGCVMTDDDQLAEKLYHFRQFGHEFDHYISEGINAKNSEFHAAMGHSNLKHISSILQRRKEQYLHYLRELSDTLRFQMIGIDTEYNYAYMPVIFDSERKVLEVMSKLEKNHISPRRYFHPSLNTLEIFGPWHKECESSEYIASRILCLPIYHELSNDEIAHISAIVNSCL